MGMEKAPVELVVTEEAVTASHYGSAFTVDREDIASLEVLEELPEIRRVAGTGLPSAQTGTFRSEDWGPSPVASTHARGPGSSSRRWTGGCSCSTPPTLPPRRRSWRRSGLHPFLERP